MKHAASPQSPAPIARIGPAEARRRQLGGARLVDIREPAERATGYAAGSEAVAAATLVATHATDSDRDAELLLICASGQRSQRTAAELAARGFRQVASVEGGLASWRALGLPEERPHGADAEFSERYLRHLLLPEVGEAGQRVLQSARVALVGAGGLGSPTALYLAAAGVGTLGLVDDDRVERSNLQRQVLHTEESIGTPKVESARRTLQALNPGVQVQAIHQRLHSDNVESVLSEFDVVIDGADNLATRYLLSDACVHLQKPLVYGAVHRFEGQASVFDAGRRRGHSPCYRCLFPQPPPAEFAPNCSDTGVLGVVPGLIGMLQATETLKLLLGLGTSLDGRLLQVDVLGMRFRETRLQPDPDCAVCAPGREFPGYIDYLHFCSG